MASGRLIIPLAEPCIDNNGALVSGATLTVRVAGGPTLASLFANASLSTPIFNPQTSNAAGRFYAQSTEWWADASQAYDITLAFPDGESFSFLNTYTLGAQSNVTGFAPINSPVFTGNPQAPTPASNDDSNSIATTDYVQSQNYAPINSPALTGTPTAPTAAPGVHTTQIATTAFVTTALGVTAPTNASSGYFKIAGVYLQWTTFSLGAAGGASVSVTWPIQFPTAVMGTPWTTFLTGQSYGLGVSAITTAGCTITKNGGDPLAATGTVWAFGN